MSNFEYVFPGASGLRGSGTSVLWASEDFVVELNLTSELSNVELVLPGASRLRGSQVFRALGFDDFLC
jgi:hypothetical protein